MASDASNDLRREIEDQSKEEADAILEKARQEAKRILADAGERAGKLRKEILQAGRAEADANRRKILSGVQLERQRQELDAREGLIQEAFRKVRDRWDRESRTRAYGAVLKRLIEEGAQVLDETDLVVCAGEREKKLLTPALKKSIEVSLSKTRKKAVKLKLSKEKIEGAGLVMESKDGRIRFDNRLEARMKRMESRLKSVVVSRLWKETGGKKVT